MPDLNQYLSLSDFQPFFDNTSADDKVTFSEEWRVRYFQDIERIVVPAVMSFFKDLKLEGRISVIPNCEGYVALFWESWNGVARLSPSELETKQGQQKLSELAYTFAVKLTSAIVWPYELILKHKGAEAAAELNKTDLFNDVVVKFNQGTYAPHEFDSEKCLQTGLSLRLAFKDWAVRGCYFDGKKGFLAIEPLSPPQIQESVVELKTGNLMCADWYRIPEFTKLTREDSFSLEARIGRENQARFLAEQFGVVSVCVSNTSPDVFVDGDRVIVGSHYDEDGAPPERFTRVGRVCTDLWAATIVEYETLVELVARKAPDTAKEVVEAYVSEHEAEGNLYRFKVEPGTYYLYHYGDYEHFVEKAEQAGIHLDAGAVTPYFVLSRTRLLQPSA